MRDPRAKGHIKCPAPGGEPTGAFDCTYTYEKVGEISIDELEGKVAEVGFRV